MSYNPDLQKGAVTFYAMELTTALKDKMKDYSLEHGRTWFEVHGIEAPYPTWDPQTAVNYLLFRGPSAADDAFNCTMYFK